MSKKTNKYCRPVIEYHVVHNLLYPYCDVLDGLSCSKMAICFCFFRYCHNIYAERGFVQAKVQWQEKFLREQGGENV